MPKAPEWEKRKFRNKPWDKWLTSVTAVIGVGLFLVTKTRLVVTIALLVMFGLLWHPVWNFPWIERRLLWRVSALTLLVIGLASFGWSVWPQARSAVFLFDRDPESWRGHTFREKPLRLDESAHLEMPVNLPQRFNPQIAAPESMFRVIAFLEFPDELQITAPQAWQLADKRDGKVQYSAELGDLNPGVMFSSADEAFYLVSRKPQRFEIRYSITGRGERSGNLQQSHTVSVEAK